MDLQTSDGIKVFSCNANVNLAKNIADNLNVGLADSEVSRFSDGEICMRINELVRGIDVFIVQPTCTPVNDNLMELLIMADALRRASASRITAVIPYFGYARQDRKSRARDPISAKLVADLITAAGVDRVLTMDLHCDQIQGFFNIPVDHLRGLPLFAKYYRESFDDLSDVVIVSPDLGSVTRARALGEKLDRPLAIIDKRRPSKNTSEVVNIIGNVRGCRAIITDDIIDTAGSICNAATAIMNAGAKEVFVCCTHGILSGKALENIDKSPIKELISLDTIPLTQNENTKKIKVLSTAEVFADAISRIHTGLSISKLFD
ncbi:MAG: ribose-phosphate pyrophosphokinase [Defluviitaleaceae bacterium]|nr:ribose-phosphate pyrophosphokinase [Defluviitaleaceae bacterium]